MTALPDVLYKYTSLERPEWIREVIAEHKLWFSSPFDFNDPFDCRPRITIGNTPEEISAALRWIEDVLARKQGMDRPTRRRQARQIAGEIRKNDKLTDQYKMLLERAGVYCLSARSDHPLMWSHYASCHSGICLGFSTSNNPFFPQAQPVRYNRTYPTVKLSQHKVDWGRESMLTKSEHWSYEDEWRLTCREPGHMEMPEHALVRVILGCRISDHDRDQVRSLCAASDDGIEILQASMHPRQYTLEFRKIAAQS